MPCRLALAIPRADPWYRAPQLIRNQGQFRPAKDSDRLNLESRTDIAPALRIIPRDQHIISRKNISKAALRVLYRLNEVGYTAYLVGGDGLDLPEPPPRRVQVTAQHVDLNAAQVQVHAMEVGRPAGQGIDQGTSLGDTSAVQQTVAGIGGQHYSRQAVLQA